MIYRTKEEMLKVLGENLRAQRLAANISQQTAADRSGVSLKAIRNLELGENSSTLSLLAYCRTLGKVDWLMAIRSTGLNRPLGPRVYFGFIFAH